jgi:hypothetical protein
MPRLDITKYIKVLGDYYDRNFTAWRTSTRFSINADYEAIEKEAFTKAQQWYRDFSNNNPTTYRRFLCDDASESSVT